MDEKFQLPVEYKGEELGLNTSLLVTGFMHKFIVEVFGQEVIFELDEDRNYRAIIPYDDIGKNKNVDQELLKEIASVLQVLINQ